MLYKLSLLAMRLIAHIPMGKSFLKYIYFRSLRKIKTHYAESEAITDIILTSNIKSKQFRYGLSDLNFLIIVNNNSHPKTILNQFRDFIQSHLDLNLIVNTEFIPILNESEIKTDVIKSYLIRKSDKDVLSWLSVLNQKNYRFIMRMQDHYAVSHHAMLNLDYFLFRNKELGHDRKRVKAINRSLIALQKQFPDLKTENGVFKNTGKLIENYPLFKWTLGKKWEKSVWKNVSRGSNLTLYNKKFSLERYQPKFIQYLNNILQLEFIEDIILQPSLIQENNDFYEGKIYLNILVNQKLTKKFYISQLTNLKEGIRKYQNSNLKFRIRFMGTKAFQLLNEKCLYHFPLEPLIQKQTAGSLAKKEYPFIVDYKYLNMASIHFMTTQFMRFRSLQQKTDLIGSRFIKALNLMYKYALLHSYLKGEPLPLNLSTKKMRELFTPQFNEIALDDNVTNDHWKLIKAQLIYLLKEIREELSKQDQSLKLLKF